MEQEKPRLPSQRVPQMPAPGRSTNLYTYHVPITSTVILLQEVRVNKLQGRGDGSVERSVHEC